MSPPVVVGTLLAVAALLYVLAPLLWPRAFGVEGAAPRVEAGGDEGALERLRDDLFARIVDLDFDHAVGKTDEEEYRAERADLKRQALETLRLLDERAARATATAAEDDTIEREVRALRERRAAETPDAAPAGPGEEFALEDEVERQVRALRRERQARPVAVVPAAGLADGRRPRAR